MAKSQRPVVMDKLSSSDVGQTPQIAQVSGWALSSLFNRHNLEINVGLIELLNCIQLGKSVVNGFGTIESSHMCVDSHGLNFTISRGDHTPLCLVTTCNNGVLIGGVFMHLSIFFPRPICRYKVNLTYLFNTLYLFVII
jgi:hypothetical protein